MISVERKRAMCLRLSDDEMAKLAGLARELGMPKVSLIRQWIRDASRPGKPFDEKAFLQEFRRVFAGRIRRG